MDRLAIVLFISGEGPPESAGAGIYIIESRAMRCSKILQKDLHTHAI
jgi:hypothetical protein